MVLLIIWYQQPIPKVWSASLARTCDPLLFNHHAFSPSSPSTLPLLLSQKQVTIKEIHTCGWSLPSWSLRSTGGLALDPAGRCSPMLGLRCSVCRTVAGCSASSGWGCCCLTRCVAAGVLGLGGAGVVVVVVVRRRVGRNGLPRVLVGRGVALGVGASVLWGSSARD